MQAESAVVLCILGPVQGVAVTVVLGVTVPSAVEAAVVLGVTDGVDFIILFSTSTPFRIGLRPCH